MKRELQIQQRAAQPYVGIQMPVTMEGLAEAVDTGFPEVFGWLAKHGVTPAGPPFIRYLVIGMETELEIELAVTVGGEVEGDGRVRSDVLPAGRYVTLRHVGPFDALTASNATLQQWAQERGSVFDSWDTDRGSAWRGRVEHFLTDPSTEPDPDRTPTADDCSAMLLDLHAVLRWYPGELPMLGADDIQRGLELLDQVGDALSEADVELLRAVAERLRPYWEVSNGGVLPLHGDTHPGNLIARREGGLSSCHHDGSLVLRGCSIVPMLAQPCLALAAFYLLANGRVRIS